MILLPLTRDQAMAFVVQHHRHCKRAAAHRAALGLEWGGALVGVVMLGNTCRETMKREPFAGWMRVERSAHADGARDRTEVLWLNAAAAQRLPKQLSFQGVA